MIEIAKAAFLLKFKTELIQFQGLISFSLLLYWIAALWGPLRDKMRSDSLERVWTVFCLLFGVFLGVVSALDWGSEYGLVALSIGLSIGLAMAHATVAVCLCVSLLFLRPWELIDQNDYFAILPKLTFAICLAHILALFATQIATQGSRKFDFHWNRAASLLIFYALWCYVTTFKAPDPVAAQVKYSDTLFKSIFLYLMILNVLETRQDLRILVTTLIITFLGVGLIAIYQTAGLPATTAVGEDRLIGIGAFANANDIAALMVWVFPYSMTTALKRGESWLARIFAFSVLVVVLICIYLSQSRGAMMGMALAIGLYVVLKIKKRALTLAFVIGSILAVPAYVAFSSRNAADLSESSQSRMTYIKTGLVMGLKNPVLGVGFESYELNFERYATEILYEWGNRTAHNSWVLAFAETGLLGVSLFIAVFVTNLILAWQVFSESPEFLLSLAGYGVAMSFLSHTYLLYPYLLYAMIGVANRVTPRKAAVLA